MDSSGAAFRQVRGYPSFCLQGSTGHDLFLVVCTRGRRDIIEASGYDEGFVVVMVMVAHLLKVWPTKKGIVRAEPSNVE